MLGVKASLTLLTEKVVEVICVDEDIYIHKLTLFDSVHDIRRAAYKRGFTIKEDDGLVSDLPVSLVVVSPEPRSHNLHHQVRYQCVL